MADESKQTDCPQDWQLMQRTPVQNKGELLLPHTSGLQCQQLEQRTLTDSSPRRSLYISHERIHLVDETHRVASLYRSECTLTRVMTLVSVVGHGQTHSGMHCKYVRVQPLSAPHHC